MKDLLRTSWDAIVSITTAIVVGFVALSIGAIALRGYMYFVKWVFP